MKKFSQEKIEEFYEKSKGMAAEGISVARIAKTLGISTATIYRINKLRDGRTASAPETQNPQVIVHQAPNKVINSGNRQGTVSASRCIVVVTKTSDLRRVLSELS